MNSAIIKSFQQRGQFYGAHKHAAEPAVLYRRLVAWLGSTSLHDISDSAPAFAVSHISPSVAPVGLR